MLKKHQRRQKSWNQQDYWAKYLKLIESKKKIYNTYEIIKINTETYAKNCIDSMTIKNKKKYSQK